MRRFGPFELEARLGRGGSAEVWRALRRGPHGFVRVAALKRLLPERLTDARLRQSLLDEARLAARLTHPNVAQVLEVVEVDGEPAILMELVDGCDLRTLLRALAPLGPPPPGLAVFVAHEVCRALGAAHALHPRILHRDVSSTNVLLARTGEVKLTDFGIGKALEEADRDGRTASLKGNLGYMAPEQLSRAAIGPAADVYAAGVLLWETLTGRRLFAGAFDLTAMADARRRAIAPPSTLQAALPPSLDAIVARATAYDASARFRDGAAMADALGPLVHQLGFGPTQLALLMHEQAPPPTAPEPGRHTVTVADAAPVPTAMEIEPPRLPRRRPKLVLTLALTSGAALGAWLAIPRRAAPPPPIAAPLSGTPQRTTAPRPMVLSPSPSGSPSLSSTPPQSSRAPSPRPAPTPPTFAHRPPRRTAPPPAAPPARAPDLVDGKLIDPFHR